ncbi:MAG: thiosulfate sulfurtransferase GlpE [Pseudomonadota bacterium]
MADSITPNELKALMAGNRKPALFDVRRKADFDASPEKIHGAARLDPEEVEEWIADIPKDEPVVVYCVKGGSVSQSIADRLRRNHPDVKFLQGGLKAWAELGEPVGE